MVNVSIDSYMIAIIRRPIYFAIEELTKNGYKIIGCSKVNDRELSRKEVECLIIEGPSDPDKFIVELQKFGRQNKSIYYIW